jgi:iron complex outermembrane recepter protein
MAEWTMIRVAHVAVMGGLCVAASAPLARAEDAAAVDLGTVQAVSNSARGVGADTSEIETAPYQAPGKTPLEATQPTTLISQHFIENSVPATGNYDDVIKFSPSVYNAEPNGPGLQESKFLSIRGFQDGQYNVIFDGIPWLGSPTDFHHQSAVYFTEHDIGSVEVDRGPGTASTIGVATFGGTISLKSRDPDAQQTVNTYGTVGSFNTTLWGTEVDSGSIKAANGAAIIADYSHQNTDGYLTNASGRRSNFYMKAVAPLNTNTALTIVAMYNDTFQHVSKGSTSTQQAKYGDDYGLGDIPSAANFYGNNRVTYTTDFEYIGLVSDLGRGWTLDNKIYTNAFYKTGYQANYVNGADAGTAGSQYLTKTIYLNGVTKVSTSNDVPGKVSTQDYRSVGDILRISKDEDFGQIRTGVWFDRASNNYSSYQADLSLGGIPYATTSGGTVYNYLMQDWLNTIQPYVEVEWKPLPRLTIIPGVKYSVVKRTVDAPVDSGTKTVVKDSVVWMDLDPSLQANYRLSGNWSAYAQAAKGFQAPPLDALYANGSAASVQPYKTWNYQAGTAWQSDQFSLAADVYYIDFQNYFYETTDASNNTVFIAAGGAVYKGVEVEGTYHLGHGFNLYGNATLNNAKYTQSKQYVANAPVATGALGVIYNDKNGWYSSLIGKYVGSQEGLNDSTQALTDEYRIPSYAYADFAVGYTLTAANGLPSWLREVGFSLKANNIFNDHSVIGIAGTTKNNSGATVPLEWINPGRSFFASVSIKY